MKFHELDRVGAYDGIWACASILHVAKRELPDVLRKMADAAKDGGVLYASFKYGEFEGVRDGRYFTCFTEEGFRKVAEAIPELTVEKQWITDDVREERREGQWLNLILRKRAVV